MKKKLHVSPKMAGCCALVLSVIVAMQAHQVIHFSVLQGYLRELFLVVKWKISGKFIHMHSSIISEYQMGYGHATIVRMNWRAFVTACIACTVLKMLKPSTKWEETVFVYLISAQSYLIVDI